MGGTYIIVLNGRRLIDEICKKNNIKILIIILVFVIVLGVGYASISSIILNISGTSTINVDDTNFNVHFVDNPPITPTIDSETSRVEILSDTVASLEVVLKNKGECAVAQYTVKNDSKGIGARIKLQLTNSNPDYFKVSEKIDNTELESGNETIVKISVELIKIPIENVTTKITGVLDVEPIEDEIVDPSIDDEISIGYLYTGTEAMIGDTAPNGQYNLTKSDFLKMRFFPFLNKHYVVDNKVKESYIIFKINSYNAYSIRGGVSDASVFENNVEVIKKVASENDFSFDEICSIDDEKLLCNSGSNTILVSKLGDVRIVIGTAMECRIDADGYSVCNYNWD